MADRDRAEAPQAVRADGVSPTAARAAVAAAVRPSTTTHGPRAELYFGLREPGGSGMVDYEQRWQAFLDEDVTPRFPEGFSVLDAYGQWQRRDNGTIERLNSKRLVVPYPDTKHRHDLDALRGLWKQRTRDESVLLSITPAEVSF